ncbi:hypothetical protein Q9251_02890 [Alkalihalobacillus macyae]|nr:hypothetical protein [Alkalihalobacillus macyae]MDP4549821.1 hypothetical protein [Alkalihalobacillus macyae]
MSKLEKLENENCYLKNQIKLLEIELLQTKMNQKLDEMIRKMS